MELLIIFIVMMVISSILRSFRGMGRTFTPSAPSPEMPGPSDLFDVPEESMEEAAPLKKDVPEWMEFEQKAPEREATEREKYVHAFDLEEARRKVARPQKAAPVKVPVFRKEEYNMEKQLHELLGGENLPLGIVAMEVFSAPRARRPFKNPRA